MSMISKEEYERRKAAQKTQRDQKITNSWFKKVIGDPITIFTGVLAIVAIFQLRAMLSTDEATHDLAKAAVDQAKTALDQAKAAKDAAEGIKGQLEEMRGQRLLTIAQLRANLSREDPSVNAYGEDDKIAHVGDKIAGFAISPVWRNVGSTNAKDVRSWFELKVFDIPSSVPKKLSGADCPPLVPPDPLPQPTVMPQGGGIVQLAKRLSLQEINRIGKDAYALMWGHVEYRDEFPDTPLHFDDWCVGIDPSDVRGARFSFPIIRELRE
jgi:hypothetical protein